MFTVCFPEDFNLGDSLFPRGVSLNAVLLFFLCMGLTCFTVLMRLLYIFWTFCMGLFGVSGVGSSSAICTQPYSGQSAEPESSTREADSALGVSRIVC